MKPPSAAEKNRRQRIASVAADLELIGHARRNPNNSTITAALLRQQSCEMSAKLMKLIETDDEVS